jgi:hypothetical protein
LCASESDTELIKTLLAVHAVLEETGVAHALCGGMAANLYREELRTTVDVDLYVICAAPQVVGLARTFEGKGWSVHPAWEKAELIRLDRDDLPRVDLLIAGTDFERQAVRRATPAPVEGHAIPVLRAEDLIVFKLAAGRYRDYEAVAAIINTRGDDLDTEFIEDALSELGMEERWTTALEGAEREAEGRG